MNEVHKKYYITQSNLRKLVFKAGIVERDLSNLYEDIFDRVDLRQYVSWRFVSERGARSQ